MKDNWDSSDSAAAITPPRLLSCDHSAAAAKERRQAHLLYIYITAPSGVASHRHHTAAAADVTEVESLRAAELVKSGVDTAMMGLGSLLSASIRPQGLGSVLNRCSLGPTGSPGLWEMVQRAEMGLLITPGRAQHVVSVLSSRDCPWLQRGAAGRWGGGGVYLSWCSVQTDESEPEPWGIPRR
ncbi:unnamed protein product [Gadus morhua 'NCC']